MRELQNKAYSLFIDASKKRAQSIQKLVEDSNTSIFRWSKEYFLDIWRELNAVPIRWVAIFKFRWQRIKNDISSGFDGWFKVVEKNFVLFFWTLLGFLLFHLSSRLRKFLEIKRVELARKGFRDLRARRWASAIQRVAPYAPWLILIYFLSVGRGLLQKTYFPELILLFPYIKYYSVYRIFRIFSTQVLSSYTLLGQLGILFRNKTKLLSTNRVVGISVLVTAMLLHTVKSTVGEGFAYIWIEEFFKHFIILVLFYQSARWSEELLEASKKLMPAAAVKKVTFVLQHKVLKFLVSFPIMVGVVLYMVSLRLWYWAENFEFFRKISSEVFRRKIEGIGASTKAETVPETALFESRYARTFLSSSCEEKKEFKDSQGIAKEQIKKMVSDWLSDKSDENTVALIGEKGIGKTFLLDHIEDELSDVEIIKINFDKKVLTKNEVEEMLGQAGANEEKPAHTGKKVYLIDQAHNLFLSRVGGFSAFKSLLQILQSDPENQFWVISFNDSSWTYLQAVLNKTRHFNRVLRLERWSEEEMKDFILDLHSRTEFNHEYDSSLVQAVRDDLNYNQQSSIDTRFFRLLREESMGNPDVARYVWLDSIKHESEKKVTVGLPKDRPENISGLPDDFYFVLSCVVQHENVSVDEIMQATDISEDVIRNAVKVCCEKGYLTVRSGRIRLRSIWQHSVFSTLRYKNFIYGS